MNAVIYARFSSHNQTEQSIDGQLRVCYEYAEREGINVVGEYIDRALSARSADRPDFQRMIKDARKKAFDYVIVYKLDRFSRNRYDSAMYRHELKKHNVKVLSATEGIGDNPESILLEALLEASAEYYSVELSQKVTRGMRESAHKRQFNGGQIPYGYKVEDKFLVVDEIRAPIVRRIYEEYVSGKSKKHIVDDLNADGHRTAKNAPFSYNSLSRILKNDVYIGVYRWKDIVDESAVPVILDRATFEAAQERAAANRMRPAASTKKERYLLAGKLYCGHCGSPMQGGYGTSKTGAKHLYYICATRKKKKTCDKKNERSDFLDWYVVEQTVEYVLQPRIIDYISSCVADQFDAEINSSKITELERGIADLDKEMDSLIEMMAKMPNQRARERSTKRFNLLDAQHEELKIELSKMRIANNIRIKKEDVAVWLKSFANGDLMDETFRERVIDALVSRVYLYDDHLEIWYNVKDAKQNCYIDPPESSSGGESGVRALRAMHHQILSPEIQRIRGFLMCLTPKSKLLSSYILAKLNQNKADKRHESAMSVCFDLVCFFEDASLIAAQS